MSEWPVTDGLDPPGEQLELPWLDPPTPAEVTEVIVHRVRYGPRSWSCSCGAGREWPDAAEWRSRRSARVHLHAVRARIQGHDPG